MMVKGTIQAANVLQQTKKSTHNTDTGIQSAPIYHYARTRYDCKACSRYLGFWSCPTSRGYMHQGINLESFCQDDVDHSSSAPGTLASWLQPLFDRPPAWFSELWGAAVGRYGDAAVQVDMVIRRPGHNDCWPFRLDCSSSGSYVERSRKGWKTQYTSRSLLLQLSRLSGCSKKRST